MKVAALFGVGGNIGKAVALRFLEEGYQVAVVSRTGARNLDGEMDKYKDNLRQYSADLGQAEEAVKVWKAIKKNFPTAVSFVFYNAAKNLGSSDILEHSLSSLRESNEINTISVFALAREAINDFKQLPASVPKTFIFTGNGLDERSAFPRTPPSFLSLSIGKSATAHFIDTAAQTFGPEGYKFYYIDERLADGSPAYAKITGAGHADMTWELSQGTEQGDWRVSFINGKGKI